MSVICYECEQVIGRPRVTGKPVIAGPCRWCQARLAVELSPAGGAYRERGPMIWWKMPAKHLGFGDVVHVDRREAC